MTLPTQQAPSGPRNIALLAAILLAGCGETNPLADAATDAGARDGGVLDADLAVDAEPPRDSGAAPDGGFDSGPDADAGPPPGEWLDTGVRFTPGYAVMGGWRDTPASAMRAMDNYLAMSPHLSIMYYRGLATRWDQVETSEGVYDWSGVDELLDYCRRRDISLALAIPHKMFRIRTREGENAVPAYMLTPDYDGGAMMATTAAGDVWQVKIWNPAVHARYVALLESFADRYRDETRIAWVGTLDETATSIAPGTPGRPSNREYADAIIGYMAPLRAAAPNTLFVIGYNTLAGGQLDRIAQASVRYTFGMSAPDFFMYDRGSADQRAAFRTYRDRIPLLPQVQIESYSGPTTFPADAPCGSPGETREAHAHDIMCFGTEELGGLHAIVWRLIWPDRTPDILAAMDEYGHDGARGFPAVPGR